MDDIDPRAVVGSDSQRVVRASRLRVADLQVAGGIASDGDAEHHLECRIRSRCRSDIPSLVASGPRLERDADRPCSAEVADGHGASHPGSGINADRPRCGTRRIENDIAGRERALIEVRVGKGDGECDRSQLRLRERWSTDHNRRCGAIADDRGHRRTTAVYRGIASGIVRDADADNTVRGRSYGQRVSVTIDRRESPRRAIGHDDIIPHEAGHNFAELECEGQRVRVGVSKARTDAQCRSRAIAGHRTAAGRASIRRRILSDIRGDTGRHCAIRRRCDEQRVGVAIDRAERARRAVRDRDVTRVKARDVLAELKREGDRTGVRHSAVGRDGERWRFRVGRT